MDDQPQNCLSRQGGSPLKIAVISIFPDMFGAIANFGITSRALKQGLVELKAITPRDFAHDRHSTVDDRPFGGGPGMVMMVQPLRDAIAEAKSWAGADAKVIAEMTRAVLWSNSGMLQRCFPADSAEDSRCRKPAASAIE